MTTTLTITDTNRNVVAHLGALKALGIDTIIRYYNRLAPSGEKSLHHSEAIAIIAAGMKLGIVYEGAGDKAAAFSAAIGRSDASFALRWAQDEIGQPAGSAIYFAVDFDALPRQVRANVTPYFLGVRDILHGRYKIGAYGSGLVLEMLQAENLIDYAWISCSWGWTHTRDYMAGDKWHLLQYVPKRQGGIDTDPNRFREGVTDAGFFDHLDK